MPKVCLFSPVKGKVLRNGKPVADAVVVRAYDWISNKEKGGDETKTSSAGEFAFPAIYKKMILGSLFPHEPVVRLRMRIKIGGREYEAFECSRHNYKEGCEFGYDNIINPLELVCELTGEPQKREAVSGDIPAYYYGIGVLQKK